MTAPWRQIGSSWFTIPAYRPFAQDLARGLTDALAVEGPENLSRALVLTPTRRGARALADAFIGVAEGRAILPPQLRPLGDLDEGEPPFEPGDIALDLPAAIEPLRRRFELTRLAAAHWDLLPGRDLTASGALEMAEHWQISRRFLEAALAAWPSRLAELGLADVSERRVRLLRRLAEHWTDSPPTGVIVAAGSTGTAPATRDLLIAIAGAPQGCVVLPGLDQNLAEKSWAKVDVQHPQGALKRLLDRAGVQKDEVATWPASRQPDSAGRWRQRLVNEALRPAEETADWLRVIGTLKAEDPDAIAKGLAGLSAITARTEDEAATAAALLLREALETPERTAALVTPDQALARRVTAKLARWGVTPDSSAGESLAGCPAGVLARLVVRAANDPLDPVILLGLLKHPLARLGDSTDLERHGLRGPRARTWEDLRARLGKRAPEALPLAERLQSLVQGLSWTGVADPVSEAARRTAIAMEAICADDSGQTGLLWAGHGGEAMARLLAGLVADAGDLPPASPRGFADMLERLMASETIRSGGATHPRLRILGAIEARLVRADRLVVAGLEEGVWPASAALDPFLSRPMREDLGLPSPERRIGLSAHDFAQAACAPEVILLHTERREGAPSVKSRWLWRLETLARGAGLTIPSHAHVLDWARGLDAPPEGPPKPMSRPAPCPPVHDRPRELAVTRVENLVRDPYAVWARDILRLYALRRPDEAPDARERGTAIHKAFERFAERHPRILPDDTAGEFEQLYIEALAEAGLAPESLARERALAREAALWVAEQERARRADGREIHVELKGALTFPAPAGPFTITARADRIEATPDGYGHILDYKTGRAPSKKEVDTGFSPQLTLTAAILQAGGFAKLGKRDPGDLTYLEITGRRPAGKVETRAEAGPESRLAAQLALEGVQTLAARYDEATQPYLSRIAPQFLKARVSDYDHLARVFEWSTGAEDDE